MVVSSKLFGQRAIIKYAEYTGAQAIVGKFVPGTLTNHGQVRFKWTIR